MAITYTISRAERLGRVQANGTVSAQEIHRIIDTVLTDPDLTPGMRALVDARDAEPDITILQLAEVANRVLQLINRGLARIAIVAKSGVTYRVGKTFSVLARALGIEVDVFTEIPAAEAWLEDLPRSSDTGGTPLPR